MKLESSEARKTATLAISSRRPHNPRCCIQLGLCPTGDEDVRSFGYAEAGPHNGLGVGEADFGPESYLPWKMAWLMSGQNSRNTRVIPSREAFRNHR